MGHQENDNYKYENTLIKRYSGSIEKGEIEQGRNEFDILHFLTLYMNKPGICLLQDLIKLVWLLLPKTDL
jgi:DNA-binding winged helix-turn-helix (wHTH) protein